MTATFEHADDLVRKRGGRWTLVARDPLLKLFFRAGGDYEFLVRHPDALAASSGGNEVDWELDGDEVVLSHQLMKGPACRVRKAALVAAASRLATTRRVARPRASRKSTPASKKARTTSARLDGSVVVALPGQVKATPKPAPRRTATR